MAEDEEADWHAEAASMTDEAARQQLGAVLFGLLGSRAGKKVAWRQANKPPEKRARWLAGDLVICLLLDGPFEDWDGVAPAARRWATAAFAVIAVTFVGFFASFLVPRTGLGLLVGEALRLPVFLVVPFAIVSIVAGLLAPDGRRGVRVRAVVLAGALALGVAAAVVLPGGVVTIAGDAPYAARPLAGTVRVIGVSEDDSGDSSSYRLYVAVDDLPGYETGDYVSFDIDSGRYDELLEWCDDIPDYLTGYDWLTEQAQQAAATGKPLARIEMLPSSGTLVSITPQAG